MKKAKVSKYGQWKYPGQDTIIPNANGSITMKGVPYPVLGIDDMGNQQMMMPGMDYKFPGNSVYEIPMMAYGGDISIPSLRTVKIKSLPKAQDFGTVEEGLYKIAAYEKARGSRTGSGVSKYGNPRLKDNPTDKDAVDWMIANMLPIAKNYYTTPTEQVEAIDFIYNTGRDPRVYQLDQYLRSIGQPGLPNRGSYNIDYYGANPDSNAKTKLAELDKLWQQHGPAINKLSVNQRRQLLNKGRDFYYQNIEVKPDGSPSDAYYNTWYGRIWNTNDARPFDPKDPRFVPKRQEGGQQEDELSLLTNRNRAFQDIIVDDEIVDQEIIPKAQAIGVKKPNFNQKLNIPLQFQQAPNLADIHVNMPHNSGWGDFITHRVPSVYDAVRSGDPYSIEEAVNKYLGYPMDKAYDAADRLAPEGEDPIDSFRHPAAAMYTQQAIKDKVGFPVLGDALGFLGANASGIGHELSTLFNDERPWDVKLREAGEDAFNNFAGSVVGLLPGTQDQKANLIYNMSLSNWLPDGVVSEDPNKNMYLKDEQGNVRRDTPTEFLNKLYSKKQGGVTDPPNTTNPEKPYYGSNIGKPTKPYQVVNNQYVFTLPDGTTWSTTNRDQANSINAYIAKGWGFTGERTASGEPAWARIPKTPPQPEPATPVQTIPVSKDNYTLYYSGNPGVAYLHAKIDNGDGTFTRKNLGATEVSKWLTDEQQKQFHSPGGGMVRVNYNPDIKIYSDVKEAINAMSHKKQGGSLRKAQVGKQAENAWIGPGAPNNPYVLPPLQIIATPNRPPYNNISPYSNPKPNWGEDMPPFLRPGPTIENSRIDYLKKGLQPDGKPRPMYYEIEHGNLSQDAQPDGPIMELLKFADPTGFLSWGDANRAYNTWKESGRPSPTLDENLDMFSAVPALGKFGKIAYITGNAIKPITKFFKWQQALNLADLANDWLGIPGEPEISQDPNFVKNAWLNITKTKGPKVIKTPTFATGGDISVPDLRRVTITALPKAQTQGEFKFSYDWTKSPQENMELNRRADQMGWNSVEEYKNSNWGQNAKALKKRKNIKPVEENNATIFDVVNDYVENFKNAQPTTQDYFGDVFDLYKKIIESGQEKPVTSFTIPEDYYTRLMQEENGVNRGLRDNRYYQYPSHEKGTDTIGYGHKLTEEEQKSGKYKKGLTKDEAIALMRKDVQEHLGRTIEQYNEKFGSGAFDKLHPDLKVLALDYVYNGIPIYKFPNFFGAANKYSSAKDASTKQAALDEMLKQYVRHDDKGVPLGSRNEYTKSVLMNLKQKGGLPKAQTSVDWEGLFNPELLRRARVAGWDTVEQYRNAKWAYNTQPTKSNKEILIDDVRKVNRPTAVAESTMPANMPKAPLEWEGLSGSQIIDLMKAQAAYEALPEAAKRRDELSADTKSDTEKLARKAWTAISHPMETLSAVTRGYSIPYGYMGMQDPYEGMGLQNPTNWLVDMVIGSPAFVANAITRQGEQIVDNPGEYLLGQTLGLFDPKYRNQAFANYMDLAAAIPAVRAVSGPIASAARPLVRTLGEIGTATRGLSPSVSSNFFNKNYSPLFKFSDKYGYIPDYSVGKTAANFEFVEPSIYRNINPSDLELSKNLGYLVSPYESRTGLDAALNEANSKYLTNYYFGRGATPQGIGGRLPGNAGSIDGYHPFFMEGTQLFDKGLTPRPLLRFNPAKAPNVNINESFLGAENYNFQPKTHTKFRIAVPNKSTRQMSNYDVLKWDPELNTYVPNYQKKQGGNKKKQPGFQVLTDANGKYVFVKT